MKKAVSCISSAALFFTLLLFNTSILALETEAYAVDPVHSTALFKVGHYGFGFVRGGFTDISGTIIIDRTNNTNSEVDILIKTASIDTDNAQRDEHLKSKDFFDVKRFPDMRFKSIRLNKYSENLYEVIGDFTLHGVTRIIKVPVRFIGEGKGHDGVYRAGFESEFSINRSDYGMTRHIPAAGDKVDVTLVIEVTRK